MNKINASSDESTERLSIKILVPAQHEFSLSYRNYSSARDRTQDYVIAYLIFRICCSSCLFASGISSHNEATSLIRSTDIGRRTNLALATSALNSASPNVASKALRSASTLSKGTRGGSVNNRFMSLGPMIATWSSHFAFSVLAKSKALGTFSRPGQGFSPT